MTRKKWFWSAAVVVVLVGGFLWALRPQPVLVEVAEVRRGLFSLTVDEDGKTRVRERYLVSAPLAGQLARIELKPGDEVTAGTAVAQLSPAAPAMIDDARTARELAERVGSAQAAHAAANANMARHQAALAQAEATLARQRKLQQQGFIASAALEQAVLEVQVQSRSVEAARFVQEGARHDLAQARAALMRVHDATARPRPGTTWPIESPVAGRVLRVLQESEATVAVGMPLMEIADTRDLEVVVDVLSTDGARIKPYAPVLIEAGAEFRFAGWVRRVEPAAFTKVSALGVEEQRVNVVIDITSPRQRWATLGDQFRVDVKITVFEQGDAVIVPVAALFRIGPEWGVFVAQDGRAVQRLVKIGARTPIDALVEGGLQPGEHVIVYPSDKVGHGKRVRIVRSG
jgi:HlyD family secretion protein